MGVASHKPRLFYLDWVRALSVILIVITHFNNPFMGSSPIVTNHPFGIYIGTLGVSQFLIISGAALMYSYEDQEHLNFRAFYWKRFKSLYPMFWIAFVVANTYLLIRTRGAVANQAPKWSIIYSILGVDGYLANAGIATFYTLGEWFLGFIIIFYFIFPVLRYGVKQHPWITAVVALTLYVLTLAIQPNIHGLPEELLISTRLPELLFGMYFVRYWKKVPHPVGAAACVLLIAQQFTHLLKDNIANSIVGILFFLVLVWIGEVITYKPLRTTATWLSAYSYPIFLVHHVVIIQIFSVIDPSRLSANRIEAYLLFFADCVIILVFSFMLQRFTNLVLGWVSTLAQKTQVTKK